MYMPISPLMTDFYKTIHHLAYAPGLEYLTSYWTPRMTRVEGVGKIPQVDKIVMFGLQAYIKDFLIDTFNREFFYLPYEEVHETYVRLIKNTMSEQASDDEHLKALHSLGYLPLKISAVDEGTRIPIRCPMIEITNTVPGFAWLVNYLETPTSASIWHPMTTATIADFYFNIVKYFYDKTVVDVPYSSACGDFSMRGMSSPYSAMPASAGHLLSFTGTATIPAIPWLEEFYNCNVEHETVGRGVPSMEHSVMETYGEDGEFEAYRHFLEDVFPKGPLSMVCDTWDYWRVVTDYIPRLKPIIMAKDGKAIIRGDSGDPVDIICGTFGKNPNEVIVDCDNIENFDISKYVKELTKGFWNIPNTVFYLRVSGVVYKVTCFFVHEDIDEDGSPCNYYSNEIEEISVEKFNMTPEMMGTIECLWESFGGYVNEKGYKVLDSHIGAIYGDSITPARAWDIYERLMRKGFASNCVTLGIGSYTYQYVTRDSFGFCLKATHCRINGEDKAIFKDPKTDKSKNNNFKKSQRGMCHVYVNEDGNVKYEENLHPIDFEDGKRSDNLLTPVFIDGAIVKNTSLKEIRHRLHPETF